MAQALITLKEPVTDPAALKQRPIVNLLYTPRLAAEKRDKPAVYELVENVPHDVKIEQAWSGEGFRARQILISNGQQTLGVALPWGIASCLVRPNEKTLSISGDGGFLFSAMELETAVRLKLNLVHMVWINGTYDMVAIQEQTKYQRTSGVDFGPIDVVKYAEAFGAVGIMIDAPDQIGPRSRRHSKVPGQFSSGFE